MQVPRSTTVPGAASLLAVMMTAALVLPLAGGVATLSGCQSLDSWAMKRRQKQRAPEVQESITKYEAKADAANPTPTLIADEAYPGADAIAKARTLATQGLDAEALAQFEAAIEKNPLLTAAYMGSGELHYKKGDLPKAEERFGKAALLEPTNFDAQYWHALVLQEQKKFDESIRAYLRALSLRPDDVKANSNLAAAYLQAGEPGQALPYAQRAVQLAPNDASSRINLGAIFATLGQHESAITEYQQAAELTELSPPLLLNLADSYGRVRRYEEMVGTLEQVIKLEPSAVAYERLGSGLFRLADYEGALEAFQQSAALDPNHYPAHNGVGVCLLRRWVVSGQNDMASRDEALRALRRSLQIDSNQPRVLELVGRYQ